MNRAAFDNHLIADCLSAFKIKRSLSNKGAPYDNVVAKATFKSIKTEFVNGEVFDLLAELDVRFNRYVTWFNSVRIHSTLDNLTPLKYKQTVLQ